MTANADPWYVQPRPPIPLPVLAERYSPAHGYATIAVRPDEVDLGDVADHTDGLMIVTEITRRHATWSIAGHNPALPYRVPNPARAGWPSVVERPLLTRDITIQARIRVRRPATSWARLAGHTQKITTHNPTRLGMYTVAEGWDAACSCGWKGEKPYRGKDSAREGVMRHRAEVLTDLTDRKLGNLAAIQRLETQLGDVLPWRWDHGAQAQLCGLTTAQALARLAPWAEALGVAIETAPADHAGLGGEHFLWVDSRVEDRDPRLDIRAFPTYTTPEVAPATVEDTGSQPCGESVIAGQG